VQTLAKSQTLHQFRDQLGRRFPSVDLRFSARQPRHSAITAERREGDITNYLAMDDTQIFARTKEKRCIGVTKVGKVAAKSPDQTKVITRTCILPL
jgi:hypothetical protein